MPEELAERFLRNVIAFETAAKTTNFQQLTDAGIPLPPPDTVADSDMSSTLWRVINGLADLDVFLNHTNHLSDRELYTVLWTNVLREELPKLPKSSSGAWHVDLPGRDPEGRLYLKYYASEKHRAWWREDFPEYEMPAHEDPPYDRDRHLPVAGGEVDHETRH
jgi:hypothetical protein